MLEWQDDDALDGNAAAGLLAEIFAGDLTSARVTCRRCGSVRRLAESRAYVRGPGTTLRCSACTSVLGRLVKARETIWLELTGMASVQIPAAPA